MLSNLADWVTEVINSLGYLGVALLVALENVFPTIPSEIVLPCTPHAMTLFTVSYESNDKHYRIFFRGIRFYLFNRKSGAGRLSRCQFKLSHFLK